MNERDEPLHDIFPLGSLRLTSGRVIRLEHSVRRRDGASALRIISEPFERERSYKRDFAITIPAHLIEEFVDLVHLFTERADFMRDEKQRALKRARTRLAQESRSNRRFRGSRFRESALGKPAPRDEQRNGDDEDA